MEFKHNLNRNPSLVWQFLVWLTIYFPLLYAAKLRSHAKSPNRKRYVVSNLTVSTSLLRHYTSWGEINRQLFLMWLFPVASLAFSNVFVSSMVFFGSFQSDSLHLYDSLNHQHFKINPKHLFNENKKKIR